MQVYVFGSLALKHGAELAEDKVNSAVLLLGIMGEGDEQFNTSWIKGLQPGSALCVCVSVCVAGSWAGSVFSSTLHSLPRC